MTKNSLHGLYVDKLRDIYNAEKQLTKALPKMAKAATTEELRNSFTEHLKQTRGHVERALSRSSKRWTSEPPVNDASRWRDWLKKARKSCK